ncbi:ROK family protein, partial [Mesorhizobium sp. M2A.F.Ca.ET.046.02.1.1]
LTVLDETARYLAQGIAAIAAVANPEKVILGGSIGLRPEILSRVKDLMPLCFPYPVTVEAGELGARAALIGAAAIGLGQLHNTLFGVDAPDGRISLPTAQAAALKEVVL